MRVRVNRAFLFQGERQEIGTEVDVPAVLGVELVQLGKASALEAKAPTSGPMTTANTEGLVAGRKRKET